MLQNMVDQQMYSSWLARKDMVRQVSLCCDCDGDCGLSGLLLASVIKLAISTCNSVCCVESEGDLHCDFFMTVGTVRIVTVAAMHACCCNCAREESDGGGVCLVWVALVVGVPVRAQWQAKQADAHETESSVGCQKQTEIMLCAKMLVVARKQITS
jgi:hypothetical protein